MVSYHARTKHSYCSVRTSAHRLDWAMQPTPYKRYDAQLPRFAFELSDSQDRFLYRIGGINAKKSYPGVAYFLRMNPAAGALYPNELYVQIRGVQGKIDGIYHYEVFTSSLTLLYALAPSEGLERWIGENRPIRGYLFFVSMVPWRSAWKYKDRAFRYCLLDGGHLLGAIEASALLLPHATKVVYRIDKARLNAFFGFADKEFFLSAAIVGTPIRGEALPRIPETVLPTAAPTDTFSPAPVIVSAYRETNSVQRCKRNYRAPRFDYNSETLQEAIFKRRSQRAFVPEAITKGQFRYLAEVVSQPILSDCDEQVDVYIVVNRVVDMPCGVWHRGDYLRYGDFSRDAGYLCLEQYHLASDGAISLFMVSRGKRYQALYQKAGMIGHRLYIAATYLGLGCSGIGAYYDDEVCTFLGLDPSETMVLYAMAIGR